MVLSTSESSSPFLTFALAPKWSRIKTFKKWPGRPNRRSTAKSASLRTVSKVLTRSINRPVRNDMKKVLSTNPE
jgi:hypothetical protein